MLFPYAEMDMEAWLNLRSTPMNLACLSTSEQRLYLYTAAAKLVSALTALHQEVGGLVTSHHDLKPRNILLIGENLMIADLGMSNLVYSDRAGGSGINGANGIGTRSYRPPEYFKDHSWEKDETRKFGRAFDMWAMGCIMIQLAVLIVWGWDSGRIQEFRRARERFVAKDQVKGEARESLVSDDSFVKSIPVVAEWLTLLQEEDGSTLLRGYLAVVVRMLRPDPSDRIYSWEAELDLDELLYPDKPRAERQLMTANLLQRPMSGKAANGAESPLHRAAARGNAIRVVGLLELCWPADQRDRLGRTPTELAEQYGHFHLREVFSRAGSIEKSGPKHALRGVSLEPVVHTEEQRGLRPREELRSHTEEQRGPRLHEELRSDTDQVSYKIRTSIRSPINVGP